MSRIRILMMACALAAQCISAAEIPGKVVDAQTGEPIARARVTIRISLSGGQVAEMAVLTDASGTFIASNLPDGTWQFSCDKPGYRSSSAVIFGDSKSTPVLRLARQAVIAGAVVDERGVGVPFASVQLFQRGVMDGRRQINAGAGAQTDDRGEFRIFGLAAGRYYVGANAQLQRRSKSVMLAYAPVLYPGAADIAGAQPVEVEAGSEEHVTIRLPTVPAHRVRGKIFPAGRYPSIQLRPQDRERFPIVLSLGAFWDEKSNTFTISGVPPGSYLLEATTQVDGRQARAAVKPITVGDEDIEGILLTPGTLPEITGTVTIDGKAPSGAVRSHITLRSPRHTPGAEIQNDGSFRIRDVPPDSYQVSIPRNDSTYIRLVRQGGREVQGDKILVTELENQPLEIDLRSHGGVIEGVIAVPDSGNPATLVGLFRTDGDEIVLHKQAYVNSAANRPPNSFAAFMMQGVAPGEYLLLAWPSDAGIAYAEPESMREYRARGKGSRFYYGGERGIRNLERPIEPASCRFFVAGSATVSSAAVAHCTLLHAEQHFA